MIINTVVKSYRTYHYTLFAHVYMNITIIINMYLFTFQAQGAEYDKLKYEKTVKFNDLEEKFKQIQENFKASQTECSQLKDFANELKVSFKMLYIEMVMYQTKLTICNGDTCC